MAATAGLVPRLNAELPPDVKVRDVQVVSSDFAAMSNLWKRYVYTVPAPIGSASRQQQQQAVDEQSCERSDMDQVSELLKFCRKTLQNAPGGSTVKHLDLTTMRRAATVLEGTHDFASFQSKYAITIPLLVLYLCVCRN